MNADNSRIHENIQNSASKVAQAMAVEHERVANILENVSTQVGEWADNNFVHHEPELGVIEEIGEGIAHPILKRAQSIRGFGPAGDPEADKKFNDALEDGIADVGIYLLHFCYIRRITLGSYPGETHGSYRKFISRMAVAAGELLTEGQWPGYMSFQANIIWGNLQGLAHIYGFNAADCIDRVWSRVVAKRDWKANPENAAQIVHAGNAAEAVATEGDAQ